MVKTGARKDVGFKTTRGNRGVIIDMGDIGGFKYKDDEGGFITGSSADIEGGI